MKKTIIKSVIFIIALILGAIGLEQTGLFTAGEALLRAIFLLVVVGIFLFFRFLIRWLKKTMYKIEMKNPKYHETDSNE